MNLHESTKVASRMALGGLLLLTSCGAGQAIRPKDLTYATATGTDPGGDAICHDVNAGGSPLIVDWRPEDRGDLEVAMKQGVAFVHYDCHTIRLVPDCTADGVYGFIGITRKEQVISLTNADEAKANLPLNGGSIGASIGVNASIDIGLVMVGKRTTTFAQVTHADMHGKCDGATHFVRAATIGAYTMQTGTAGSVKSAGELFGIGASAGSSSSKSALNKDGDVGACASADPDAPKPPGECGALLRVQLVGVGAPATAAGDEMRCPEGLVATDGKCAPAGDELVKKCQAGDSPSCESSCKARVVGSCVTWGNQMIERAMANDNRELKTYVGPMADAFQRACDLADEESCAMLAGNYRKGLGVPRDTQKAFDLAKTSCLAGSPEGCVVLGFTYDEGTGAPLDHAHAARLYERACNAGAPPGCFYAGQSYGIGPEGVDRDPAKSADFYDRACDANMADGCLRAGKAYEEGAGVQANRTLAMSFYHRGCENKNDDCCAAAKRLQAAQ